MREVQYRDGARLAAREALHAYGRGDWFPWWAAQIDWPEGAEVLEVGCGRGTVWREAAGEVPASLSLTLSDLSPGMVDEALAAVGAIGRYRIADGLVADARALPFADSTFDVVVANHMLYHVPDPAKGVAEIARVLRADGVAMVATNGRDHLRELWELRDAAMAPDRFVDPLSAAFGIEAGEPLLRERFASLELRRYADTLRCTNPADVVAYLASMPPFDGEGQRLMNVLADEVGARFERAGGVLEIGKDVGLFVCRRPGGAPGDSEEVTGTA